METTAIPPKAIPVKSSSIMDHLVEMRDRMMRSAIAVVITTIVALIFSKPIFDILTFRSQYTKPVFDFIVNRLHLTPPPTVHLVAMEMTENFTVYFQVCLFSGIILAIPYVLYEAIMFITPALTDKERRYFFIILPWVLMMFLIGVVFAYFILLPPALTFLMGFGADIATTQIRVGNYVSVVSRLLLAVGLSFELPVLLTFLQRLGVIKPQWLAKQRKWAIVLAFVLGGIITPTPDPINQSLVSVPLYLLYEMSIWLGKLVVKKKTPAAA
jgi:sec-independent protein translocase protein TatC